jgi:hypothetical protein
MKFVAAKCPSCQGELQIPDDKDFVKCMYCGVEVKVRDAMKISLDVHVPNLLRLGNEALNSANYEEAYNYFNKVLEVEINNYDAWYGKGASMWTTWTNVRATEMLSCFDTCLQNCPEEKIVEYKEKISHSIYNFAVSYYQFTGKILMESVAVGNTWSEYLYHCENILTCLEKYLVYTPNDEKAIEFILSICKANRKGYSYSENQFVNGRNISTTQRKTVSAAYAKRIDEKIIEYENILRELNPEKWTRNVEIENAAKRNENTIKHNKKIMYMCLIFTPIIMAIIGAIIGKLYFLGFGFLGLIIGAILAAFLRKPVPPKIQ